MLLLPPSGRAGIRKLPLGLLCLEQATSALPLGIMILVTKHHRLIREILSVIAKGKSRSSGSRARISLSLPKSSLRVSNQLNLHEPYTTATREAGKCRCQIDQPLQFRKAYQKEGGQDAEHQTCVTEESHTQRWTCPRSYSE